MKIEIEKDKKGVLALGCVSPICSSPCFSQARKPAHLRPPRPLVLTWGPDGQPLLALVVVIPVALTIGAHAPVSLRLLYIFLTPHVTARAHVTRLAAWTSSASVEIRGMLSLVPTPLYSPGCSTATTWNPPRKPTVGKWECRGGPSAQSIPAFATDLISRTDRGNRRHT